MQKYLLESGLPQTGKYALAALGGSPEG